MKNKFTRHGTDRAGFTLAELMIALVIIMLVAAGYAAANIASQRIVQEMNERTIAIQDANRVIEQMRNASRTPPYLGNVTATFNGAVTGITNLPSEQVRVSYDNTGADPLLATVAVTWTSYAGRTCTETVETFMTQR